MAYYYSPFRKKYKEQPNINCVFCDLTTLRNQAVKSSKNEPVENKHFIWVVNYYPKFEGHTMIVPKRHTTSLEEETEEEILARNKLILFAIKQVQKLYPKAGVELFLQYGPGSEASIPHLHWHLVPAQEGDQLRSFEKLGHFYTTKKSEPKMLPFPIKIERAREKLQRDLSVVVGGKKPK
ncbi:HIT family protein [Patescibacteria group bacterium]|nr:HIT family protein [Patescibacteria group bacterium]